MKDLFFTTDLVPLFRDDKHYGNFKSLSAAMRKLGVAFNERADGIEQMLHSMAVHLMDQGGESEPFLTGTFIYPETIIKLLKEKGLPTPAALQPASQTKKDSKQTLDHGLFEQYFDIVCRNCGTVTDPDASHYRTPLVRLIFKTYLETRLTLGINTTAKYIFEHLKEFDTEKIVTSVEEDYVTWTTEDSKEKITSIETIAKRVLDFNRVLKNLL